MDGLSRRHFLAAVGIGVAGGVAGCGASSDGTGGSTTGEGEGEGRAGTPTLVATGARQSPTPTPIEPHPNACDPATAASGGQTLVPQRISPGALSDCERVAAVTEPANTAVETAVGSGNSKVPAQALPDDEEPVFGSFEYVQIDRAVYEPEVTYYPMSGLRVLDLGEPAATQPVGATIVHYTTLPQAGKAAAAKAIRSGPVRLDHHASDGAYEWARDADYLAFRGEYYPVKTPASTSDEWPHFHLALRPVTGTDLSRAVVTPLVLDLAPSISETIRTAIERGRVDAVSEDVAAAVRATPYALTLSSLYRLELS